MKPNKKRWILVCLEFVFFVSTVFFGTKPVFAESVDITAYTGWCLGNITGNSGGFTYVDLVEDTGGGCVQTATYANTAKFNNCQYQYSCGTCVSGFKTCTVTSYIPFPYACDNASLTTQTCDSTNPTVTMSVPINGWVATALQPVTFAYDDNVAVTFVKIYDNATLLTSVTTPSGSGSYNYSWQASSASEGNHAIKVQAHDAEGNVGEDIRYVIVDFTDPSISFTAPATNGEIVSGTTYQIRSNASDTGSGIAQVEYFLDNTGNKLGASITSSPYNYVWDTTGTGNGTHTLIAIATDGAGLTTQISRTVSVNNPVSDTVSPTVTFTSPSAAGATVSNAYTIAASVVDSGGPISHVKFFLDNTSSQLGPTITSSPYSYTWDTTGTANGTHNLIAIATDTASLTGQATIGITVQNLATSVDNVEPVVGITTPADNEIVDGTVTISATASDNVGVSYVEFYVDGDKKHTINNVSASTTYSYSWVTNPTAGTAATEGAHTITVKAYDGAATPNVGIASVQVTVDNVADATVNTGVTNKVPDAEITYPAAGDKVGGKVTVKVDASDNDGIKHVKFYIDDEYRDKDTTSPYDYDWDTDDWSDGTHTIGIEAFDETGKSRSVEIKVTVDNSVAPVTCTYTCTKWSDCSAAGKKTCQEFSHTPTGTVCSNSAPESLTEDCQIVPVAVACTFSCARWSSCTTANIETCLEVVSSPAGAVCSNPLASALSRACVYQAPPVTCTYACTKWNDCTADNKKSCLEYATTPAGANCSNSAPAMSEACEYAASQEAIQTGLEAIREEVDETAPDRQATPSKSEVRCEYVYSSPGACIGNKQKRIVISKSPAGCDEALFLPELVLDCDAQDLLQERPADAPAPAPQAVTAAGTAQEQENEQLKNYNGRTSSIWQKYYFGQENCTDEAVCGGDADPDNDNLSNNEEYRFGTDPKDADTDNDGYVDGGEIAAGRDPLAGSVDGQSDGMDFEDPGQSAAGDEGIYEVTGVETVSGEKYKKISKLSGKALPNTFVTLYIFSDPIVMTVKTDKDGNWSYVLDKPLELGNHEVYVAVTSNTGKIVAKSQNFAFAQTAEAAVALASPGDTEDRAPSPVKSRMNQGYWLMGLMSVFGVCLAVISIGLIRSKAKNAQ